MPAACSAWRCCKVVMVCCARCSAWARKEAWISAMRSACCCSSCTGIAFGLLDDRLAFFVRARDDLFGFRFRIQQTF